MKACGFIVVLFILAVGAAQPAPAQETRIRWFGHAAFAITTPRGKVLLIDPWLNNPANPEAQDGKNALASVPAVDYILLTHGHRDHVGDAVEIAKKTGAALICNPELAGNLVKLADFPGKQAETDAIMGIGGEIQIADGEVTIAMTPAVHSSSVFNPKASASEPERAYGGNPAGFVLIIKNGPTIYHSGDTAYFKDMETIGEQYPIDLALLNIGGHFGMEPRMAAKAAKVIGARLAIPQHYATSPGIAANAAAFAAELKRLRVPFYEMKPGETITFRGKQMAPAKPKTATSETGLQQAPAPREGQHDFDFEIGTWKTHLRRLLHPLSGSTAWVEYDGTTVARKVWEGRANLAELVADGPAGHFEGLSLRLYNPEARQMIVEVRSYHIKPGHREAFIEFFLTRAVPAQRAQGMDILGPLLDLENPNRFVWLRSFPTLAARERMKEDFYEGALWKNELEQIAMPMLESYDVILCETAPGDVCDGPREAP